ncbi:MAG TPA: hypothetical protein VKI17_07035 [Gemmataceae bacterium]|nr:hypothetical protein [Gemmataceae bacterium]
MAFTANKVEMWTGEIDDRVGGLAAVLEPLAEAGVDLEVVVARRQPGAPGKGVVFLGPIKGAKAQQAAAKAGLRKTPELTALRVDGPNKPGECQRLTKLVADAGINLRGLAATVVANKFTISLGFDSDADATRAGQVLKAAGSKAK